MKIADLYIRVSTDEQADKGYSQRNQDEQLRKFCNINNIKIGKVIYEDHSAKSFNRPEWNKLLATLKKQKGSQTDLILFTKWDRFSRNAGDAYQMISILRKLGIEPQAVEQPLDLSVPENKMMLAFYLAAPEVENDRRALNTFFGMRRAKKEGRWMGTAPIGYQNKISQDGLKFIAPDPVQGEIMKWAFEQLATGNYNIAQVWKQAREKGLRCLRNNFWILVRNPVYCGKIFIPKYKDEESRVVDGQHEPIISEATFYEVQDVLDGKKKTTKVKMVSLDHLPLRGFLVCPKCGRTLTGSPSKGKTQWYYYYHCSSECGIRSNAQKINEEFVDFLSQFSLARGMEELYTVVIDFHYQQKVGGIQTFRKQLLADLTEANNHLVKARELLVTGEIEPGDYRLIKSDCEEKINRLEAKIADVPKEKTDTKTLFNKMVKTLSNVSNLYAESNVQTKREIICSMFPEKWVLQDFKHRTPKMNGCVEFIYQINSALRDKKNETDCDFSHLSREVTWERLELSTH